MTRDPATGRFVSKARAAYEGLVVDRLDDLSGAMRVGGGVQTMHAAILEQYPSVLGALRESEMAEDRTTFMAPHIGRWEGPQKRERERVLDAAVRKTCYHLMMPVGVYRRGAPDERFANTVRGEFKRLWANR